MKDRLSDLQMVTKDPDDDEYFSEVDEKELDHQAVVFEENCTMDMVFKEAQSLRQEIALLRMDVKRLGVQNKRFLTSVRRISSIKRDASGIARDIRARGEGIYSRLQNLEAQRKDLEEKHGRNSALVRIVHSQYVSVTHAFHDAMFEYNQAEMAQREYCKTRIQRQLGIMGREITGDQIEEMIETGKWNLFSENLQTEGRTSRSALAEIENRHKELLDLEGRIREIHDLFLQIALLVEEQGSMLENIEANVCSTQDYVGKARSHIKKATRCKRKNPCKKMLCCCFPCLNRPAE
ncbi:syntaxin-11-like [Megalops cyprinoides]|uniref:syntaxin-11-like n=1 Tax=Megalops cyprinoides TaxID=118141 RepID=UPI001864E0A0|nr:syntaxin-11-like [Megalops cyprinoides]